MQDIQNKQFIIGSLSLVLAFIMLTLIIGTLLLISMMTPMHALADPEPDNPDATLIELIDASSEPFSDIETANLDALLERIGDSRIVLIGEATHGTAEFYDMRARITRELIENKGFTIVALEADWPDAVIIDQFVSRPYKIPTPRYRPFTSFPDWMWGNHSLRAFTLWLKDHNQQVKRREDIVSFYGLDLYNIYRSIEMVVAYLQHIDPAAAEAARWHYGCMREWAHDPSLYSRDMESRDMDSRKVESRNETGSDIRCGDNASEVLKLLRDKQQVYRKFSRQAYFNAEQNARLVVNGERYFRTLYHEENTSWNQRDENMLESLKAILDYHDTSVTSGSTTGAKVVIWAHNSHIGDARAAQISHEGKVNLGQLVRETFVDDSYLIGFGTDHGTVAAASRWDGPMKVMRVPPSHEDSYEQLMHQTRHDNFLLPLRQPEQTELTDRLMNKRMQRAIGVTYDPVNEVRRHYFYALLPYQFDEYIWFDETHAVKPLDR